MLRVTARKTLSLNLSGAVALRARQNAVYLYGQECGVSRSAQCHQYQLRYQTTFSSNLSQHHPSPRIIKTAASEAQEMEAKCAELRERIEKVSRECADLQDRLDRSAEEKSRLRSAARSLTSGADEEGADVFEDSSSVRAGFAGGKEDDGFMIDPRKVMRVHKSRSSGTISQLAAVVGSNVKDIVGQPNVAVIVGTVVEEPIYGYLGGVNADMKKGSGGVSSRATVVRTNAVVAGDQSDESSSAVSTSPTKIVSSTSQTTDPQTAMLQALDGQLSDQPTPVMQLTVRQLGCRPTGYPSPSRTFMNTFTVQCRGPQYERLAVEKGQRVTIIGHYGVHAVFQLDTTQWQLNPVIDVGPSGFIGVL